MIENKKKDGEKRRLTNWLDSFMQWTTPRSESPHSLLRWCGLFTLATVLRRHVKVGREYLGGWECYPSLYILFVGEQGMIKKSTSIGFVEDLLDDIEGIEKSPDGVTIADLLQRIQNANESSVYILSSEFSTLVLKAGLGIYDILTDLYDGKKKIDEGTISRGYIFAANPCLNFLGATTPKWIGANMTEDIIGGGFGSRIIPIHEVDKSQEVLYYDKLVSMSKMDALRSDLIHDLVYISRSINGSFTITDKAHSFMVDWYKHNSKAPIGVDRKLTGYYQRRPAHIHKVAMLLHCAHSDSLILDVEDFEQAIQVMTDIEPKIAGTYKALGRNIYVPDMESISKYVKEKGRVERPELLRTFNSAAEPNKMDELLTHLISMEYILMEYTDRIVWYKWIGD